MKDNKQKNKYTYIGQIVTDEYEGRQYSKLKLGPRLNKKGDVANNIHLDEAQMDKLKEMIFEKDLYLFDPSEKAPDFVKKNVAVKTEDIEKVEL